MSGELVKKFKIKPGQRLLVLNAPEGYVAELSPLPEGASVVETPGEGTYDFVQLFVKSTSELESLAPVALQATPYDGPFWVSYPKKSSKIKTDISRDNGWGPIEQAGLIGVSLISIDNTWSAMRFRPSELTNAPRSNERIGKRDSTSAGKSTDTGKEPRVITVPDDLQAALQASPNAQALFETLSYTHKKEYVQWIEGAKKIETRNNRIVKAIEKLKDGLKSPSLKKLE